LTTLNSVASYAHVYGFEGYKASPLPTHSLSKVSNLIFDNIELTVFHTPGHCPGHVVFYSEKDHFVINGDVLFNGSFGRVDLPGGAIDILKKSIFNTMFQFPESTVVYCGHGPETTIGQEKTTNYIHNF
jgi:glyoxylase-like metal-dependent hydrolase (beta-lactamase superfamily II)